MALKLKNKHKIGVKVILFKVLLLHIFFKHAHSILTLYFILKFG